jgi:hypothetical protein
MGLNERRLAKKIQDEVIPVILKEWEAAAGYQPELEIDWDTFIAYDEYPLSRLEGSILPELTEVFQRIGSDDMGREALKAGLLKIKLENTDDPEAVTMDFTNKVLYHKMQLAGLVFKRYSPEQIAELLERSL